MQVALETARLILRRFTARDEDNLVALDSDPDVMRYLTGGSPTPRAAIHHDILPAFLRSYEQFTGFGVWAVVEKTSGDFIGWMSLRPPEVGGPANVALGYRLRRSVWSKGYATEGAQALIRKGFTELGVQRVFATTYQDNVASLRVMEKLGMTLARTWRMTHEELLAADSFSGVALDLWDGDDVEYALLKDNWARQGGAMSRE